MRSTRTHPYPFYFKGLRGVLGWRSGEEGSRNSHMKMYRDCGMVDSVSKVFDKMPERDVSWGTLIGGYNSNRCFGEATDIIREMHAVGVKPSEVTMINVFAGFGDQKITKSMHGWVIKNQKGELHLSTNTALIDMHAKCRSLYPARLLSDELPERNIVLWTAMIAGNIPPQLRRRPQVFSRYAEMRMYIPMK
ncbi:hypothetical protein EJ110_NYTH34663 [Nymphaea thermarum]|nr:hypothetical protein EJ110_NYTH34663 [Nymphaea thermarum]